MTYNNNCFNFIKIFQWDNIFRFFLFFLLETFVDLRSSEILAGKVKGFQDCLVTLQFYFTTKEIHLLLALLFSVILGSGYRLYVTLKL